MRALFMRKHSDSQSCENEKVELGLLSTISYRVRFRVLQTSWDLALLCVSSSPFELYCNRCVALNMTGGGHKLHGSESHKKLHESREDERSEWRIISHDLYAAIISREQPKGEIIDRVLLLSQRISSHLLLSMNMNYRW